VQPPASEELALAALEWIEATAVADGGGAWWSGTPSSAEPDPTLYHGTAGIVLALLEADAHFSDRRWGELALRGTRWLAAAVDTWDTASYPALYFGTAGTAFALHEAAGRLGADGANRDEAETARAAAMRGLAAVRAVYDGERWGDAYELMFGNAGIGLAALRLGDAELAEAAVTPYLRTAETTAFGLDRYNYGWCHGPAGDAQVFRLLAQLADERLGPGDTAVAGDRRAIPGRPSETEMSR
jgi:hypothetical protein